MTINVRIPGWARNEPVPSDLYRFADKSTAAVTLKVNGKAGRSSSTKATWRWRAPGRRATPSS